MSLIKSIQKSDQLLLDGFRYRGDRLVCRCVKTSCKDRARLDGNKFKMYKGHICQAPDPTVIKKKVARYHDLLRLINLMRVSHALKFHYAQVSTLKCRSANVTRANFVELSICSLLCLFDRVKRTAFCIVLSVSSFSLFMPS
jgi:hypothetical protein